MTTATAKTEEKSAPEQDLDELVTETVIELLLHPTMGDRIRSIAREKGFELTDEQEDLVDFAVLRTMDQLAIPFVKSLPKELRAKDEETLHKRSERRHI